MFPTRAYHIFILLSFTFRLERLDHLAMKFKHKCDIHEAWAEGQDEYLKADDITGAPLANLLVSFKSNLGKHKYRKWKFLVLIFNDNIVYKNKEIIPNTELKNAISV